jgi:2-polyprenyl-3-methyl-5-hydroxy-6-metoxy-1,4-benzoquinol methylase
VDEAIPGLYAAYYTHDGPRPNLVPAGRLPAALRALRNGHVNARLGYALRPAWGAGWLAGRMLPPFAAIAERSVRSLPLGDRLLDVGCGNGEFVAEAGAAGWRASGIDLDAAAVDAGRGAGFDLTVETIEEHAARSPRAYDAVTLSHVVEHVADPVGFLRCARELLRPGGRVWVATPNLGAMGHDRFGRDWIHLDPPRHLVLFDHGSLERTLASAGFSAVRALAPTPTAGRVFAISEAVRRGAVPANDHLVLTPAIRLQALRAELAGQRDHRRAEELLMIGVA